MKILFCSNYFTHHQKPMSDQFDTLTNHGYIFLKHKEMDNDRKILGWENEKSPAYVYSAKSLNNCASVQNTDVIIAGSFPEEMLQGYINEARLLFRYSERPLKTGNNLLKYPIRFMRWHYRNPPGKPIYLLCASAYTAGDYRKFGLFRNRCYKWGYFPETRRYPDFNKLFAEKSPVTLLWCGRFLDWKHPDDALKIARCLKDCGVPFALKLIGTGPLENALHQWVWDNALQDCVEFLGTMSPDKVRDEMERSGIFLFTSDRQEGWGAVLNEAMNSGCAVVASDAIGSVPYLVKDQENGMVYHSGDVDALCQKVTWLLDHPEQQRSLGQAAYHSIKDLWNAEVAAERFIQLAQAILDGDSSPDLFADGPCSRAEIIREDWYRG